MSTPIAIDIAFLHLSRSDAVEAAIRRRVNHLGSYCEDLRACRVVVEQVQRHSHQGRPYEVRVDLTLNGHELVVNHSRHEDVYVALRNAFDDMGRRLEEKVRRRRAGPHHRESVRTAEDAFNAGSAGAARGSAGFGTAGPSGD